MGWLTIEVDCSDFRLGQERGQVTIDVVARHQIVTSALADDCVCDLLHIFESTNEYNSAL